MPELKLGDDKEACQGETVTITTDNSRDTYLWNNGNSTNTIDITNSGEYILNVTKDGCKFADSVNVNIIDLGLDLIADSTICNTLPLTMSAEIHGAAYLWSDGSTSETISTNSSGKYSVDVTKFGCTETDSVKLNFVPELKLGDDKEACQGETVTITTDNSRDTYLWNNGN
ncbi:MAG: hypothetical protein GY938_22905, partial [Ketobacter sp.]|nr:hypothetical protein [Ketobacter sp.]